MYPDYSTIDLFALVGAIATHRKYCEKCGFKSRKPVPCLSEVSPYRVTLRDHDGDVAIVGRAPGELYVIELRSPPPPPETMHDIDDDDITICAEMDCAGDD